MSGRPNALMYGREVHAKLMRVKSLADREPIPYGQLAARRDLEQAGHELHPMDLTRFGVEIPYGYRVAYTVEEVMPGYPCRHLAVSGPNTLPAPEAVSFLMEVTGFSRTILKCKVWTEPVHDWKPQPGPDGLVAPPRMIVNVLEPAKHTWEAFWAAAHAQEEALLVSGTGPTESGEVAIAMAEDAMGRIPPEQSAPTVVPFPGKKLLH